MTGIFLWRVLNCLPHEKGARHLSDKNFVPEKNTRICDNDKVDCTEYYRTTYDGKATLVEDGVYRLEFTTRVSQLTDNDYYTPRYANMKITSTLVYTAKEYEIHSAYADRLTLASYPMYCPSGYAVVATRTDKSGKYELYDCEGYEVYQDDYFHSSVYETGLSREQFADRLIRFDYCGLNEHSTIGANGPR